MDSRWQELIDWMEGLRQDQKDYYADVKQRIITAGPEEYRLLEERVGDQVLQSWICDDTEFVMVPRFAAGAWEGKPWQIIWDVTQDMEKARWWLLAFVIDTAINHRRQLGSPR